MLPPDFEARFRRDLSGLYAEPKTILHEAIAYVLSGPGKLVRPKLVLASTQASCAFDDEETWRHALPAMLAVEMVHCYSLTHDDLPAMDDDDYRRGRLSCHKKFGEAVAILVGDALAADAIKILASAERNALRQITELSDAIGSSGMVLGQHADILALSQPADESTYLEIHHLKTARLFECACVMGALSVGASEVVVNALREFAGAFGLAFQLRDDLKDNDATVKLLGRSRVEGLHKESVARARSVGEALRSSALLQLCHDVEVLGSQDLGAKEFGSQA